MVTRDEIAQVVKRNLSLVLEDGDEKEPDPDQVLTELGLDSLDLIEVVSNCMNELKVKLLGSESSKLTTLNQVVNFFYTLTRRQD